MSARHYEILSRGSDDLGHARRRLWLQPNEPLSLGEHIVLRLLWDREDLHYLPRAVIQAPQSNACFSECPLLVGEWLDLTRWCDLLAIPVAIERDMQERPLRYLLEFVALSPGMQFTDEGGHRIYP